MEPQELAENTEKAKESGERAIGLTMAILAVLLAVSTLLSHRAHTEEVLLETRATDQWNYYQAKNIRYHVYDARSEEHTSELQSHSDLVCRLLLEKKKTPEVAEIPPEYSLA